LLALQILRAADLAVAVDVERREPEQPRAHHRQADDVGVLAGDLGAEFGKRQFGGVPLAIECESRENLVMAEHRPGCIDGLGLDGTGTEITKMVVVGGRNRKLQAAHAALKKIGPMGFVSKARAAVPVRTRLGLACAWRRRQAIVAWRLHLLRRWPRRLPI